MLMHGLREDLLEASESRFHREVAGLQVVMFEERRKAREQLLRVVDELVKGGETDRVRVADAANDELNRTWRGIRELTYQAVARLREEKAARDRNIRGFTP